MESAGTVRLTASEHKISEGELAGFAKLAHFGQRPNLSLQSLIVLPLDLKLRLQLLDQQVQVRNLHAKFLDVRRCRSWPTLGGIG
jgi:hypothetical protein